MTTTLGAFDWSTVRGIPAAGQVTLASNPLAAVANTLRVSITDNDGNNRDAVIATVADGDVIRVSDDFSIVVDGTPVDNVTYWSFPFTVASAFVSDDEPSDDATVTVQSRTPAAWPDDTELAKVLNVTDSDWDTTLARVLASAIAKVKSDVGVATDPDYLPTDSQAQAALRMAELIAERPGVPVATIRDPTYLRLLTGQRRRFGVG